MLIYSSALLLTILTAPAPQPVSDLAPGVNLVRFFNTVESREKSSNGYKTTQELQSSHALDNLANQQPNATINLKDLSNPIAGWSLRIYTSEDRQHYLIRAESATGAAVYSDEQGIIQTASPLR